MRRHRPIGFLGAAARRRTLVAFVATTCLALGGCVALPAAAVVSAGFGVVGAYSRGELRVAAEHPYDDVVRAVQRAVEDLEFELERENGDEDDWFLVARDELNTPVSIRVNRRTALVTTIRIRIGALGDREMAGLILQHTAALLTGRDPFEDGPFNASG